jgi:hypothetical protein
MLPGTILVGGMGLLACNWWLARESVIRSYRFFRAREGGRAPGQAPSNSR